MVAEIVKKVPGMCFVFIANRICIDDYNVLVSFNVHF